MSGQLVQQWPKHPLIDFVQHKSGDSKIIKGKQSKTPQPGLVQGYSASGPDIWVPVAKYNQSGVVISAVGARCGKTFLAQGEWTPIANTHALIPSPEINVRWLWYLTNDEDFWIRGGSAQPFVKVKDTLMQPVAIPPLEEQQRIVSILDEAFANITYMRHQFFQNTKRLGELVQSSLSSTFNGIKGWTTMALQDCAKFIDYRGRTPKKTESGLRLITAKNAKMGYLQIEPMEFVAPESYDAWMTRGIPLKGDVIFTTEAPLGNVCQLDTDEKVVFAQRIITLQTDREILNPSFLKYTLMSPQMQSIILEQATGATVSGIKAKLLKKIEVSFPKLEEQDTIVQQLDLLFENANQIEQVYHQELDALDELKQSILQEAFNGTLRIAEGSAGQS